MLISVDSFDHYDDVLAKYVAGTAVIDPGAGRKGTAGITTDGATFFVEELTLNGAPVETLTIIKGVAIKLNALPSAGVLNTILQFMETDFTPHVAITVDEDGLIGAYLGTQAGTEIDTSVLALTIDTYYYIEVKVFIDDTTGTVLVKVWNEAGTASANYLNLSGKDTKSGGTGLISVIGYGADGLTLGSAIPPDASWDDFYTCDGTGSAFNGLLGNKHIQAAFPVSAGFYTQWQPFPTTPNYANVSENPPDDDTSYNFAPSVDGDTDTFELNDVADDGLSAVVVNLDTRLETESADGLAAVLRLDGVDLLSDPIVPETSYGIRQFPFETAPGGLAWTTPLFNDTQAGYSANSAITYWLLPYLAVYAEASSADVTAAVPDRVYVMRVFMPYNMLVSRIATRIDTVGVGKFWGTGLYSEDGNTLVIDSGPLSASTTGIKSATFSPVFLEAGMYWYAWTCDSSTPAVPGAAITLNTAVITEDGTEQFGFVANASAAGQLPSTMGSFTPIAPVVDGVPISSMH